MSRLTALRLAVAATLIAASTGAVMLASQKSAATMQHAATQFLDSLSPDQKATASFPFDSDERLRWHFIPNEMFPRKGLMIKDMNETQRALAFDLLRSGLSSHGYVKVRAIMELEDVLKASEAGGRMARDKEEYLPLSGELQGKAIVNPGAPGDIVTMNRNDIAPLPAQGVTYASLDAKQRERLLDLIAVYTGNMERDIAAERMARIKAAGMDTIRFAWMGEAGQGRKHYYLVQGPTFLIEYDNTQNNGNHIHSVWRDFNGDFGRDILREHLEAIAH